MSPSHTTRFDRVPERPDAGSPPSRTEIIDWWHRTFGVDPSVFEDRSFWERGRDKLWVFHGDVPDPGDVEALGLFCLRTGGAEWKPTTNAIQRFGGHATKRIVTLDRPQTRRFVAGDDVSIDASELRGYVVVVTQVGGADAPLGVGQVRGETLTSTVPKGRRRDLLD